MPEAQSSPRPIKHLVRAVKDKSPRRLVFYFDEEAITRATVWAWLGEWGEVWQNPDSIALIVSTLYDPAEVLKFINSQDRASLVEAGVIAAIPAVPPGGVIVPAKPKRGKSK